MAAFGMALQVLQIVPASSKAERPSVFSTREADQDFLNNLKDVMERRDEALDKAAARAEAREAADTDDETPRRGEGVSEAAPNHEKRKESAADDTAGSSDNDPVTDGDEVTNEPTSAEGDAAPREDEEQPSETADASTKDDTGDSVASDTAAAENGNRLNETVSGSVTVTSPAEGETVVAAAGTPSAGENVTAALKATDVTADQGAAVPGNADEVIEAGAAPTNVSTAPAAVLAAAQTVDDTTSGAPVEPVQATDTAAQSDSSAKDIAPAQLAAAAAPGEELASAVSGAMSVAGKGNGKPQETVGRANQTEAPKVVLTPKTDGDVKRPMDSGAVHVASAEDGEAGAAGSSSKSKGFAPTAVSGNRQSSAQATQTGLQNALASVTNTQGEESNSALKLASLVNSASTAPSGSADAPKATPASSSATAPLPQAAAAANPQALQNTSNLASPLRAAPPPPPPPNPAAFQVAIHVARALDDGLERINIRLHPANLGRVEVKLEVAQDGRVTVTVIADKADTLDMLQRDSRALERALQDAGLRTDSESLNFGLRDGQDRDEADEAGEGDQHADGQNDDDLDGIGVHGVIPPSRPLSAQAGALDIFV